MLGDIPPCFSVFRTFNGTAFFDQSGLDAQIHHPRPHNETLTNSVTGKTLINRGVFQDFFAHRRHR